MERIEQIYTDFEKSAKISSISHICVQSHIQVLFQRKQDQFLQVYDIAKLFTPDKKRRRLFVIIHSSLGVIREILTLGFRR